MLMLMIATSTAMSGLLYWPLAFLRTVGKYLLAFLLPIFGALAYSSLVLLTDLLVSPELLPESLERGHEGVIGLVVGLGFTFVIGIPIVAGIALLKAFYIAVPMSLLHVGVLSYYGKLAALKKSTDNRGTLA